MKICITGANCFIGRPLVQKASELGWEVVAVVREGNKQIDELAAMNNVSVIELNLDKYNELGNLIGVVDTLVMLTWNGTRGASKNNRALQESNFDYCMAGIKSSINKGCRRVITAGSQAEYGNVEGLITEETEPNPNTEYGRNKLKLYKETSELCTREEVIHIEPRFFSLYGPNDYENTLIMSNIKKMRLNEKCDMTKCFQLWDFLYIDDAITAFMNLCASNLSGVYNFGSGDVRPLSEYVKQMKKVLNSDSELNFGEVPYGTNGPVSIMPSVEKLKALTNWMPETSFGAGILKIVESL